MSAPWPFDDARKTAVITTRQVLEDGEPILRVSRDSDDGGWQFHTAGAPSTADARVLSLDEIVDLDPTVAEQADLPLGWVAVRTGAGNPWIRFKKVETSDETAG
jgi:hypothetical protein